MNLDISEGAFVALVGQSGSGKSTLLHLLALIDDVTRGWFVFCGMRVDGLPEHKRVELRRRTSSFIFQDTRLIDEVDVRANIAVGLRYRDIAAFERQRRIEEAMDLVGIAHRAAHRVRALSAGQQRRVEIARAIASRPRILFADEPTGDLDACGAAQMLQMLRQLSRGGTTVVMATHSAEYAAIADDVIYLADGLRIVGTSSALRYGYRASPNGAPSLSAYFPLASPGLNARVRAKKGRT
jgi:putative ABC transport system ATP-binding protein